MACKKGRVRLKKDDDHRLFAESAGTCLRCNQTLFPDSPNPDRSISIAERAHVVAHSDGGPRADPAVDADFKESIENLILLCPTCHTIVDKDPEGHPDDALFTRKSRRAAAVALIGGTPVFDSREEARSAVTVLLNRNKAIFDHYGPDPDTGATRSREAAAGWTTRVTDDIVPNNRLIVAIVDVNDHLANEGDVRAAAELAAHTDDLERKHRSDDPLNAPAARFPEGATRIFAGPDADRAPP